MERKYLAEIRRMKKDAKPSAKPKNGAGIAPKFLKKKKIPPKYIHLQHKKILDD